MKQMYSYLYTKMKCDIKRFLREEHGAVDIVAIVVMIGIAVAMAVLFKNQISGLLGNLFGSISGGIDEATAPMG